MKIQSTPITFIDQTDSRKLEVYIKSNLPTVQIYNQNTGAYTPDWREGEKLTLTTDVFLDSRIMTTAEYSGTVIKWYIDEVSDDTEIIANRNLRTLQITTNELATNPIITYICEATYQGIVASMRLTFARVDTGLNGEKGNDGTSIKILGTADSVALVPDTNYYTITYSKGAIVAAALGDAYVYQGDLYVCSVLDGSGTNDYFVNVGPIQGQKGADAKSIVLSGNSQTFKISKTNTITPSTITVVAQVSNTSITSWSYSTNGGQTFLSTLPNGVVRDGNIVTITGSTLSTNSLVIKASDGTIEDVFTVYKVSDGTDGTDGDKGDPAPLAFLTNENISFAANEKGQVPLTTFTTNVVAYVGTTKVTPVLDINKITGLPSGMTISEPITTLNELILTFSIANNSTLGANTSNSGTITIPITSPVSTNLKLSWSKINTGATGTNASLVDVTPSALYFKSTTGSTGTFTPQYIYLYPRFQNATYSNWQYSLDGGANWIAASGAHGLTIGTYNSIANSLRVDRSSNLYTNSATSISFKCNSTTVGVYDTVSIAKIYDVVDLQIGGRNLLLNSSFDNRSDYGVFSFENGEMIVSNSELGTTASGLITYTIPMSDYGTSNLRSKSLTFSMDYMITDTLTYGTQNPWVGVELSVTGSTNTGNSSYFFPWFGLKTMPTSIMNKWERKSVLWKIPDYDITRALCTVHFRDASGTIKFKNPKLEIGNTATDWSPAPEDLIEEASNINVMLSNESHFFEATAGGVPTETSVTLDVIGYKGSIRSATTVGTIIGKPSAGMATTILSNGTTDTKIKIDITSALTSDIADYGALTIPITVNGQVINKIFNWTKAKAGDVGASGSDAVTFQVYSNNGYALSTSVPTLTLQTFAYIGDIEIQAGATYQWYRHNNTDWVAVSGATNSYFNVSRDDVSFSNNYMCKMQFNDTEYVGVVTIDDKNDENKVFASKPSNYFAGDLWVIGTDYAPSGFAVGTMLRAEHTNDTYADSDWVTATRYDDEIDDLKGAVEPYKQYFSIDSTNGLRVGDASINDNTLTVDRIETTTIEAKEVEVESPLTVTGRYSGSTMLQAPIINIGNFSIVVESNGSLSIVANT